MTKLWMLRMQLNLTMLLRMIMEESFNITFARVMIIVLMLTRMEMIGVDENDNKPEPEDASQDMVDYFNEDTCNVSAYDF